MVADGAPGRRRGSPTVQEFPQNSANFGCVNVEHAVGIAGQMPDLARTQQRLGARRLFGQIVVQIEHEYRLRDLREFGAQRVFEGGSMSPP